MGVLPSLIISLLLVTTVGGGRHGARAVSMEETTVSYYNSASEVMAYWQTMLPNSHIPPAIHEHLTTHADDVKTSHTKRDDRKSTLRFGPYTRGDDGKVTLRWDSHTKEDDGKYTIEYDPHTKEDDQKTTLGWIAPVKKDDGKVTLRWGPYIKEDDKKATLGLGSHTKEDDGKVTFRWSPHMKEEDQKATIRSGAHTKEDGRKVTLKWGMDTKEDDHKATLGWGAHKQDNRKVTLGYTKNDDHKIALRWGAHMKEDDGKVTLRWGMHVGDAGQKTTLGWNSRAKEDDRQVTSTNQEDEKGTLEWSPNNLKAPSYHVADQERHYHHHHVHGTGHQHASRIRLADLLFPEDVLTPGTTITPYIESSVSPAPFLLREVADSIPLSTNNFTDILSMFAPASLTMAGGIWSTLHTCEHPHPLEGERQACATSLESMVELVAPVLGTRDLRAFSSSVDVPAEGVASPSTPRYTVAAVRAVTTPAGASSTTMTCHGMTFPYAVFYCHAVNPTRVYAVTLRRDMEEGEEDGRTPPATMRALAVCHLDTSQFDPANPFFVARGLKPGDAAVCHFLSRDSVLWAAAASSAAQENGGQVVAL